MPPCAHCGAATNPGATFCAACGATLAAPPAPLAPAPGSASAVTRIPPRARPQGVTIVGILMIVFAAFSILGILFAMFAALVIGAAFSTAFGDTPWFGWVELGAGIAAVFILFFALFALALAGLALATGIGSLKGHGWAWYATLVVMGLIGLNALGALASRDAGGILGVLAAGAVIWYYFRPEVKAWFGR